MGRAVKALGVKRGGKFVLPPKNSENVVAFSEFLCPPHPLGLNFPPRKRYSWYKIPVMYALSVQGRGR